MGLKKQNYHKKFSFTAQKYQTSIFFLYKKLISSIFSFFLMIRIIQSQGRSASQGIVKC